MADLDAIPKELETQGFYETPDWALAELGPWALWTPALSVVCQILSGRWSEPPALNRR